MPTSSKKNPKPFFKVAAMNEDQCGGACMMIGFLSRLFKASGKDTFQKEEVLEILELIGLAEMPAGMYGDIEAMADKLNGCGGKH